MKFTLFRIDSESDIFLVIEENSKRLPLIVHGMLKIEGKNYIESTYACNSISDELDASGEVWKLVDRAKCQYFNVE